MRAAYLSIGINIRVHRLPGARSIVEVNNGKMDAELFRIKGLTKKYKHLIQLSNPIFITQTSAFTHLKNHQVKNWQDLQSHSISYTLGFKLAERNTQNSKVIHANDLNHAFRLLTNKKVEFVIDSQLNGLQIIKKQQLKGIHLVSPPLESTAIFHYLNSKHIKLVPALEKALFKLEASGESALIRNRIIKNDPNLKP